MKRILFILLLLWSLLVAAGESPRFHGNFYGYFGYSWMTLNPGSPWNPGNQFQLASNDSSLLLEADMRLVLGKAKATLSPVLKTDLLGNWRMRLREGALNLSMGNFDLTAGKVLMKLGSGYLYTPISVVTPKKSVNDPEDIGRSQEGVEMIKVDYYTDRLNLSAILFKRTNWRNLVIFAFTQFLRIDWYGLLYFPEYGKFEFGLAAAGTIGEGVEIHGELMCHRRSPVFSHLAFSQPENQIFTEWPLYQAEDRFFPEFLLGANVTFKGINLIAEYYHADWGLSKEDYNKLRGHFLFNLPLFSDPLASMNVGADMELLKSSGRGLMRDYFFTRIYKVVDTRVGLSVIGLVNPVDGSVFSMGEVSYALSDKVSCFIRPGYFSGKRGSEFGDMFYSGLLQVGFWLHL